MIIRTLASLAVLLGFALTAYFTVPQIKSALLTVGFISEMIPDIPVKPLSWFSSTPNREKVIYGGKYEPLEADLYLPGEIDQPKGAILLFLGVNPAGRDDPRVISVGESLARIGIVTMIPWSTEMTSNKVTESEIENVAAAFDFLVKHEFVDSNRVGLAGFCVGASIVLMAAQEDSIRNKVQLVSSFGAYYDARSLVVSVISKTASYGGDVRTWEPSNLSNEVVRSHMIDWGSLAGERELLKHALGELDNGSNLLGSLTSETVSTYKLLTAPSGNRARVLSLMESMPPRADYFMTKVSPSVDMEFLEANVYIMHDVEDSMIPVEESRMIRNAIDPLKIKKYTEFRLFDHVDPERPLGHVEFLKEIYRLFLHVNGIIGELTE